MISNPDLPSKSAPLVASLTTFRRLPPARLRRVAATRLIRWFLFRPGSLRSLHHRL